MLHKSRSKQLNAFKFALILPLLAGFVFAFNTKVVAQVQEIEIVEGITKIELLIDKDYTKAQMNEDIEFMKERDITLKFKGVKRNASGEITAINASYKTDTGKSGSYSQNSDEPIKPFSFRIDGQQDGQIVGFYSENAMHEAHSYGSKTSQKIILELDDDKLHKGKHKKYEVIRLHSGDEKDVHTWVESGDGEEVEIEVKVVDGEKVIKVNGKEVSEEELEKLEKSESKTITVKKINKSKDGNVFIIKDSDDDHDIEVIESSESKGFFFVDSGKGGQPLYIVDGKEMSKEEFKDKLSPNQIESIEVLKGESATKNYGDRAKDGVIVVTSKKN